MILVSETQPLYTNTERNSRTVKEWNWGKSAHPYFSISRAEEATWVARALLKKHPDVPVCRLIKPSWTAHALSFPQTGLQGDAFRSSLDPFASGIRPPTSDSNLLTRSVCARELTPMEHSLIFELWARRGAGSTPPCLTLLAVILSLMPLNGALNNSAAKSAIADTSASICFCPFGGLPSPSKINRKLANPCQAANRIVTRREV